MQVIKADHAQQVVYGWAGQYTDAEGIPVVDLQGDVIAPEEIEKASYAYLLDKRDNGVMHEGKTVGKIVASLVTTPDVIKAFFGDDVRCPVGWIIGVKYPDKHIFKAVVDGKLAMFSIQGQADREELADDDLHKREGRALEKFAKLVEKLVRKGGHGSGRAKGSNPGSGRKPGVKKPGLRQKPSGNHRALPNLPVRSRR